jgi:hypothetical protein
MALVEGDQRRAFYLQRFETRSDRTVRSGFPARGGMAAFKRREDAERMFATLSAGWTPYPRAITFQSELPADAPRVAPDAYCLGSVELWGAIHEYECGYLGQFVCVRSVDRIVGRLFQQEAAAVASLQKRYLCIS